MEKYYIFVNNEVKGPFSLENIVQLYISGQINGTTQVSAGRGTPWLMLSARQEIAAALQASGHNQPMRGVNTPPGASYYPAAMQQQPMQQVQPMHMQQVQPAMQQPPMQARPVQVQPVQVQPVQQQIPPVQVQPVQVQPVQVQPLQVQSVIPQSQVQEPVQEQADEQSQTEDESNAEDYVIFYCPQCHKKFGGESSWLGREVICTDCEKIFTATEADENSDFDQNYDDSEIESLVLDNTGNIICPHCWLHFNTEQMLYIASHPMLSGDSVLGEDAMKRFFPTQFNAQGQALDAMGHIATDVACPRCRLKIPITVIDEKSLFFSIVGAQSSGKSYYLATLLNCLRKKLANDFACSLIDVDPELNMVLDEYEETLFRSKNRNEIAVLPKTEQTGARFTSSVMLDNIQVYLPKPFIYELKYLSSNNQDKDCNIIFYDNAGEHFEPGTDNAYNPGTRHLSCADGIIFIFDPLNDAIMRNNCNQDEPQLSSNHTVKDQTKLLSEMIVRIRRHRNLSSNEKCSVPLVIGVCKYDSWKHLLEHDLQNISTLKVLDGDFSASWDANTVMDISFATREMLINYCPSLVNTAEGFFEKVIFIPFSNFGCISRKNEAGGVGVVPSQINPIWTQETFLALLAEYGIIDKCPAPEPTAEMPIQIMQDFLVFKHPVDGHLVRLPWSYSDTVISIAGKRYRMPTHPAYAAKHQITAEQESIPQDDLWS